MPYGMQLAGPRAATIALARRRLVRSVIGFKDSPRESRKRVRCSLAPWRRLPFRLRYAAPEPHLVKKEPFRRRRMQKRVLRGARGG